MKITFGIIVFNGDFFLREVLESIYPYAHAICIAQGPVRWFADNMGLQISNDDTVSIITNFPDPHNKIKVVHGIYAEKNEQCQAWFDLVPPDTDYVFCKDDDEIHSDEDMEKLIEFIEHEKPTSIGFKSNSFYGGFDYIIGGFERDHSFKRVLQYKPGCYYRTHRQPTLSMKYNAGDDSSFDIIGKDVTGNELYEATGITMWHGSYVSPKRVFEKINYYEAKIISAGNCIPDYFNSVFLNWVLHPDQRKSIEDKWLGVHEFLPAARGNQETKTILFNKEHPGIIKDNIQKLKQRFNDQLFKFL